ncbi:Nitroreductase [Aliiroseovarius halocynthiae]|uniref:Putative NAD(P)H nitroreductase n=1 Tax=Aliiroseovarius halocynthiae TaxID=985055 RepID=A0A545SZR8_9RHOB|nr:nitroreductase family protein [Aliiroseovarius halocynthiae]TQV70465.1 nitroreductase [Aliiroseovarius halocynthiae]SMR81814.1 Nitroreductase [Aliiroseovarius halocynthiae]
MPDRNQAALDFLLTRRSRPAKTLTGPAPDRQTVETILTAAARTPDHGKLEPWRFVVLEKPALMRAHRLVAERGVALGLDPAQIEKEQIAYDRSPLAVVVVESPVESAKVPAIEQTYSAGAVCLALLNAALASGWGANWLSGWASFDAEFTRAAFGVDSHESVAGIIHIGTETIAPPERPRPDLTAKTTWIET